jgi:hypothetical protein
MALARLQKCKNLDRRADLAGLDVPIRCACLPPLDVTVVSRYRSDGMTVIARGDSA